MDFIPIPNNFQFNKLMFLKLSNLKEATSKAYWSMYLNFIADIEIQFNKDLFEFSQDEINIYLELISQKGKSTIATGNVFVNKYIKWYASYYGLSTKKFRLIAEQKNKGDWYISKDDFFKMYNNMLENNVSIYVVAPLVFARYGILGKEAIYMRRLKWRDICYNDKYITIRNSDDVIISNIPIDEKFLEFILDLRHSDKETFKNKEIQNQYILKSQCEKDELINYNSLNTRQRIAFNMIDMKRISYTTLFNCMIIDILNKNYSNKKLNNNDDLRIKLSKYYPEETFSSVRLTQIKKMYEEITGSKSNLEVPTGFASEEYREKRKAIKKEKIAKKAIKKEFHIAKNNINNDIIINKDGTAHILVKRLYSYEEVKIDAYLIDDISKYKWYFNVSGYIVARKKVGEILRIIHLANLILQKSEYSKIGYKNGCKYDCRIENLYVKDGY